MNAPHDLPEEAVNVPPHAVEMEQSVLGALLLDNDSFDRIGELRAEHFYRYDHRLIFEFISKLLLVRRPADALTVFEAASTLGKERDIGGLAYINALAQNTPSAANIARYAEIVIDRWRLRGVVSIADEIAAAAMARNGRTVGEIIGDAQSKFDRLSESRASEPRLLSESLVSIVEQLDAQHHGAPSDAIATGFTDLDAKLDGGLNGGELVIIAGRPSMGKTAFAMNVAGNVVESGPVLVFSMEMPAKQLQQRNIARVGGLPLSHVKNGSKLTDEDWPRITYAVQVLADQQLFVDDEAGLTLAEIVNRSRATKRKHGLRLIVVDYIGLMTGGEGDSRTQQVGSYSRGLKALAKQLDVPVIALSQLNRGVDGRPNKRPTMSDLRDSGEIEQDADSILFLYRDEVYHPDSMNRGTAEVIVAKQRNGEIGHVRLAFNGAHSRFADLAPGYVHPAPNAPQRAKRGFDE
ncbi:replicative DNA helicase [Caballeronia sp. LZ033]|uniref:replicative DNA helicase n=1 Tax=Caballeronia sp. LZ033 TaxID=3038566 RepID=UPI00285658E6|nr:replicative DNA helicase [Caballeronia sp. LZ033]MDR5813340.1 replicative DNA helicase [Caballeronia sp. LZ033]